MINAKDVLRMRIPYPGISSDLAVSSHMYICKTADTPVYEFVKCQSLKPYMLTNSLFNHYCDEMPDISRNPFRRPTRIDCDKLFTTEHVIYRDDLKTAARPDVCKELFDTVLTELHADGYMTVPVNEDELISINAFISRI